MSSENRQAVLSSAAAHKFELIGRISSGLAHELNGPIGIAMGFAELAKEVIDSDDTPELSQANTSKVRGYLEMIESASLRARDLSRGIWSFAKAEPGTTENINIVDVLKTVQHLTAPAVKVAQIDVARREDPLGLSEAISHTDSVLCQQIFVELILSSPKSISGGGLVVWQVSITDNGSVAIELTTEPWNEVPTSQWEIPKFVRGSFKGMGGSIADATPTPVISQTGGSNELTGWRVVATLPPASSG
ncbi:MAG: HAMP domain-containing histidine kinase [Chloroflexi bacterium]|nr:HAMP domain-containing histidine kinase [Chloroflexota bacterium]